MVTNFFPIRFPFDTFDVQRVPYADDQLQALRTKHNSIASFFRRDDYLYVSPKKGADLTLGEVARLPIIENVETAEQMVRHLLFRTFRDAFPSRVPEEFSPLRFPSVKPEHDPLRAVLPAGLAGVIQFPKVTEVFVRSILQDGRPVIGLLILSRHRWRFPTSASSLHAEGFSLDGCSVLETVPLPGLDGILAPDETVLGEIEYIEGNEAILGFRNPSL